MTGCVLFSLVFNLPQLIRGMPNSKLIDAYMLKVGLVFRIVIMQLISKVMVPLGHQACMSLTICLLQVQWVAMEK